MKISVVVPVHNETDNVGTLIAEIHQALSTREAYEMLFVDDGSTDDTLLKLKEAMQTFPALRVLRHQNSCGQSRAIYSGVVAAQYDWIATLDGDGQNDPADIPKLIAALSERNSDKLWMLAGHRHQRHDTGWRRFSSKFANAIRQAFLRDQTPDSGCGLKLFRRDKFLALPYFDHIHRFLPAMIIMAGGEVISVKVNHRPRGHGRSKYGTLDRLLAGVVDLLGVIWLRKRHSLPIVSEVR
ncbi:glycosyltransferase family 2 protein [Methylomonas sp. SURF-2]|uniref:Glycosyltransferase family 2 protein n=1 Tax=Methylomonas subterranea TaxID=2952225 RepID=A0ABT1TH79_9GAMM|nr:glycosyltransferase family 2 protein [Methylomonas sp. SURF-2]MCQ8104825.1 glycosyltransferase family 2 protein [Methylomonas sp. SURF-2]